jgi:hypothetical protein
MFYFAPSNLPLNSAGGRPQRKFASLRCENQMDAFHQPGCHYVSFWAQRYLPADMQGSAAAQRQLTFVNFSSPWLRSRVHLKGSSHRRLANVHL